MSSCPGLKLNWHPLARMKLQECGLKGNRLIWNEQEGEDRSFTSVRFSASLIHVLRQKCQWSIFLSHLQKEELDRMFEEVVKYKRGWSIADIQVMGSEARPPVFNPVSTRFLLCDLCQVHYLPSTFFIPSFYYEDDRGDCIDSCNWKYESRQENIAPAF